MCDTFIALPNTTQDGSIIFAKNSDREANEAQQLEYHPAIDHEPGGLVDCTYNNIPQVNHTYAVLISRPFWLWGAEMGANEHGVVIGNEAVFTKLKVKKEGVLTGMDLLRLALERTDTAEKAKRLIIELLGNYGQGGICGYRDKSFTYHNSFIIADKKEAWVLETADEYWVTKKVKNYHTISNGLTIEDDYDEIHPYAETYARKKGWAKKSFGFASSFSDKLYTRFSDCKVRRSQSVDFLENKINVITPQSAFDHLRSHKNEPYNPANHLLSNSICAHAGNPLTRHASQTTGSMVAHLTKENPTYWFTATSAPCLSQFKPVWFNNQVLPDMGSLLNEGFDKSSYWWSFEELHREVLKDYSAKAKIISYEQQILEKAIIELVYKEGEKDFSVTIEAFDRSKVMIDKLLARVKTMPVNKRSNLFYREYWKRLNKEVGFKK